MSVRVLTQVFRHSDSTLAARLVLLALADAAHDDGITWIGQGAIAEKAKIGEQSVRRCIRNLENLGEIETRKAQRGRRRINVHRVVMPGLDDPDYDRLPFEVETSFTTAHPERPSDGDDRASCTTTTAHPAPAPPYIGEPSVESSDNPPVVPPAALVGFPRSVDRKPVKSGEATLAVAVLTEWNSQTGQVLSSKDWLAKIILRIREHPSLGLDEHAHIIAVNLARPWWKGHPTPSVIYGNGAQFERAKLEAEHGASADRGLTPDEIERFQG